MALLSIGIHNGDEVLVADYTFPATGHSVLYCGATPIFIDIDLKTYNIDPNKIEENINDKTKAIIVVHTFGQPAKMNEITKIAKKHGLYLIEDAACAFGAKYGKRFVGTIGYVGCFSYHARKGLTTGEGGMVVTNDEELAQKIRHLSVFGMETAWNRQKDEFYIPRFLDIGYNYKMSDITAAIGVAQMKKIEQIIDKKIELAKYWDEKIKGMDFIEPPFLSKNVKHIYQSYVALIDKGIDRNKLIKNLGDKGVQCQIGTYSSHIQPVYKSNQACPNSLEVYERAIALPIYYSMDIEDIDYISIKLKECLRN